MYERGVTFEAFDTALQQFQLPTCAHLFLSNLWILLVISDRFNKTQLKQYKAPLNSYGITLNVHDHFGPMLFVPFHE